MKIFENFTRKRKPAFREDLFSRIKALQKLLRKIHWRKKRNIVHPSIWSHQQNTTKKC